MQTSEKLEQLVFDKLKSLQSDINLSIVTFGEIHLKRKELQSSLKQLDDYQLAIESNYDRFTSELEAELGELQKKYPNGEIDLSDGSILYDVK
jgi:hypothetical protein